jgi:RNA polymerase sigma-70 factor (ECF subfamily)
LEKKSIDSEAFFIDQVVEEETHRMIHQAIQELSPKCKEIILLGLEGLKNKEIARELNLSVNTVKTHKLLAYRQLRIKLAQISAIAPLLLFRFL